ncbi:MAG: beta-ketoacyl-[acyl-carrier-protein] synthase family protein [Bacteroidales bacterium]|nr:beta-ketoacyl-[acyl-carrier-protein] synthase family protein [Bacteroidales bacterium]
MQRKVVVTAINAITALGLNIEDTWQALLKGKSGVGRITLFEPSELETQIAAEVSSEFEVYAQNYIKKRIARQMTRVTQMALVCAKEAVERHQINMDFYEKDKCAVILGVVNTGNSSVEKDQDIKTMILKGMNNSISAWISLEYGFEGPNYTVATACASSAYALALGYDLISSGKADLVITGGADSIINPEEIKGFNAIYALSTENENPQKASCPFSKNRSGFVIGEGAGVLILEAEENARKRGAAILAELSGYALTSEAYNIVSPKEDGEGMFITMRKALEHAGISPKQINHINAHGTSTTLNDLYETKAIKKLFGANCSDIPVVSSKSMIGHTIGAAGAIEAAITVKSILEQKIHPSINIDVPDPELDLNFVTQSRHHTINYAMSNSFGFGGHNASLIFKLMK